MHNLLNGMYNDFLKEILQKEFPSPRGNSGISWANVLEEMKKWYTKHSQKIINENPQGDPQKALKHLPDPEWLTADELRKSVEGAHSMRISTLLLLCGVLNLTLEDFIRGIPSTFNDETSMYPSVDLSLFRKMQSIGIKSIYDINGSFFEDFLESLEKNLAKKPNMLLKLIFASGKTFFENFLGNLDRLNELPASTKELQLQVILSNNNNDFINETRELENFYHSYPHNIGNEVKEVVKNLHEAFPKRVQIHYFNTQIRANIVIIDDMLAYFSVVLPPAKLKSHIAFKLAYGSFLAQCITYFDALFNLTEHNPGPDELHK
jgi:hypothetical protein